jgi:hypothetical protein
VAGQNSVLLPTRQNPSQSGGLPSASTPRASAVQIGRTNGKGTWKEVRNKSSVVGVEVFQRRTRPTTATRLTMREWEFEFEPNIAPHSIGAAQVE